MNSGSTEATSPLMLCVIADMMRVGKVLRNFHLRLVLGEQFQQVLVARYPLFRTAALHG